MSVSITWLGTNSFLVETPQSRFLIDPYIEMPGAETRNSMSDFLRTETILITHGHFDHLSSIPEILAEQPALVLCTECGAKTLEYERQKAVREGRRMLGEVATIAPGDVFAIDDFTVKVYPGRHIRFDVKLIAETLSAANLRRAPGNLRDLLHLIPAYPSRGETVVYEISTGGLRIQSLGSLSLDPDTTYLPRADYLVLPFQGRSDMVPTARQILAQMQPRNVILSHFDDAFPPISQTVDTRPFEKMAEVEFPEIKVTKPVYRKRIELQA